MEPESPSPYPQVPATCPYPDPTPSSPHDLLQLPEDPSSYYPPIYFLVSPMASFPQASPPTPCAHHYPPPYTPHALPISLPALKAMCKYFSVQRSSVSKKAPLRRNANRLHRLVLVRWGRLRLKCDGARSETRFRLSAKWTSPFKSAGASVQSTTDSRGVRISGSNAGYTMFRGCVNGTGYPLHSPVSPSLPLPVRHRVPSHFNWSLHRA